MWFHGVIHTLLPFPVSAIWNAVRYRYYVTNFSPKSWQWRHNERDGVSNHQPHDCLPNRLLGRRSKKTSKLLAAFVRGIHQWPVNSPYKGQTRGKGFHLMTSSCPHQRHYIVRPRGRNMGCLLWGLILICVLLPSMLCYIHYHIVYNIITPRALLC